MTLSVRSGKPTGRPSHLPLRGAQWESGPSHLCCGTTRRRDPRVSLVCTWAHRSDSELHSPGSQLSPGPVGTSYVPGPPSDFVAKECPHAQPWGQAFRGHPCPCCPSCLSVAPLLLPRFLRPVPVTSSLLALLQGEIWGWRSVRLAFQF